MIASRPAGGARRRPEGAGLEATTLYIGGCGHSGSTLLDMLLGGHSKISATGEIHRFYLSLNSDEKLHRCTCGESVWTCPFWSAVIDALIAAGAAPDREALKRDFLTTEPGYLDLATDHPQYLTPGPEAESSGASLYNLLMVLGSRALLGAAAAVSGGVAQKRRATRNSLALFRAIREAHGTPVVLDSTKNPGRMKALYLDATERYRLLVLLRDGRAVTYSRMRRNEVGMEKAARIWVSEHRKARVTRATMSGAVMKFIKYEDLCKDPAGTLTDVLAWLGLAYEPGVLEFRSQSHNIGGNPMRFRGGETTIRFDEKWREGLGEADLETFERIGGALNRSLGYGA